MMGDPAECGLVSTPETLIEEGTKVAQLPEPTARALLSALADELDNLCEQHFGIGRAGDELILRDMAQACRAVLARK